MSYIAESELIINQRGAVYHLDMKADELAPDIITVGDPARVEKISRHFDSIEFSNQHREIVCHTGWLGKKRITVLSTGMGTDNIDIVLNELDALANIDFTTRMIKENLSTLNIIRIGTAGGLQPDIPVDSMVVSTHGLGIDNLLNFYRHEHNDEENQLLQSFITHTQMEMQMAHPTLSGGSPSLMKHFGNDFHHGITVTCPGFYGPQGRILRLGLRNPNLVNRLTEFRFGQHRIANFEMETSAIYGLGKMLGHHCLSLSVIVANRVKQEFSKNADKAMDRLIEKVLTVIQEK